MYYVRRDEPTSHSMVHQEGCYSIRGDATPFENLAEAEEWGAIDGLCVRS